MIKLAKIKTKLNTNALQSLRNQLAPLNDLGNRP